MFKIPSVGMDRGKIIPSKTDQNQIRRGAQGTLSLIYKKSGGKNTGAPVEEIFKVRRGY